MHLCIKYRTRLQTDEYREKNVDGIFFLNWSGHFTDHTENDYVLLHTVYWRALQIVYYYIDIIE